jgi:hypothetical protein
LVAVEEGRGDLQHIHHGRSITEAFTTSIRIILKQSTTAIEIGRRNVIGRNKQSLKVRSTKNTDDYEVTW